MQSWRVSIGVSVGLFFFRSNGISATEFLHRSKSSVANFSVQSLRPKNPPPGSDQSALLSLTRQDRLLEEGVSVLDQGRQSYFLAGTASSSVLELQSIQWLHIPKAGTSFIGTIWGYACGRGDLPLDLNVDPKAAPDCLSCYDFALMDRYPKDMFCASGILHAEFQTQHQPMTSAVMDQGANAIGMFRKPAQRLISAYIDGYHTQGFSDETYASLRKQCDGQSVACFARYPGVAGCTTRMLTGKRCADDPASYPEGMPSHIERVPDAIEALNKMKFVGITEEWDESVCLFHLMFGGVLYSDEFHDVHQGPRDRSNTWDESELAGFVDEADEAIYDAALLRFRVLRRKYAGGDSACARIPGALSVSGQDSFLRVNSRFQHSANLSRASVDADRAQSDVVDLRMDCQNAGVQCGRWQSQRNCGVCPAMRLRFMSQYSSLGNNEVLSYRPECSPAGACVSNGQPLHELFGWTYNVA